MFDFILKPKVKVIWEIKEKARCYSLIEDHHFREVKSFLLEKSYFNGWIKTYKIEQMVPLIIDPFYDGEYVTNSLLKSIANYQKKKCKLNKKYKNYIEETFLPIENGWSQK